MCVVYIEDETATWTIFFAYRVGWQTQWGENGNGNGNKRRRKLHRVRTHALTIPEAVCLQF